MTGLRTKDLLHVVGPLALAQLVNATNHVWDRFCLSRSGGAELQASLSASMVAIMFVCFFSSAVGYSATFVAQLHGAGRGRDAVKAFAQGFWLTLFSLPFLLLVTLVASAVVGFAGHAADVMAEERAYLSVYVPGGAFLILNGVLGGLLTGQGKTRFVAVCNTLGLFVNMALNPIFIGRLGLGNAGAALSSVSALVTTSLLLGGAVLRDPLFRAHVGRDTLRPDGHLLRDILRLGLPNGVTSFASCIAFTVFILVLGSRAGLESAAVNTVFAVNTFFYALLCSVSDGVCILVGRCHGAHDAEGVRRTFRTGLIFVGLLLMSCFSVVLSCAGSVMGAFYPPDATYDLAAYRALGQTLFALLFFREIAEGLTCVLEGALRGVGDTRRIMFVRMVCDLGFWMPVVVFLHLRGSSLIALWLTTAVNLALIAACLARRWQRGFWRCTNLV